MIPRVIGLTAAYLAAAVVLLAVLLHAAALVAGQLAVLAR